MQRGFSTIEILLALALMAVTLSAVLLAFFGNQDALAAAQTHAEALGMAQGLLEQEQALARQDFKLVVPAATTTSGIYKEWVAARTLANADYVAKQVTGYVSWVDDSGVQKTVSLATMVANFDNAVGGDTCASDTSGNWSNPTAVSFTLNSFTHDSVVYPITGLDAQQGRLYVAVSNTSANTRTFFIFSISDPMHPALLGSLDNDANNTGLASVAAASSTTGSYVYAASASSFARGQLQVFDVNDAAHPTIVATYKIPTTTAPASGAGNSIFYHNGYVYLGLTKTTGGKEFAIIDVHNPRTPQLLGSYAVGHDVNAIYVANNYAYVLHPTDFKQQQQVTILDVSDPRNPKAVTGGSFYTGDTNAHGKSMYAVGSTLYVGMTVSSTTPEWYVLQNSDHGQLAQAAPLVQKEITSSVVGLLVRGPLAFLLTTNQPAGPGQLQILNAASALPVDIINLPGGAGATGAALDCEGNYLYAGSNDASNNGSITIVTGS